MAYRVYDNGIYRDATPEEIAEWEANQPPETPAQPTVEEQIAELQRSIEILGGVNPN